jgi:hypothetical protein
MRRERRRCYSVEVSPGIFARVYGERRPSAADIEAMKDVYRCLLAAAQRRKCTGCGIDLEVCRKAGETQRKCCPECSHYPFTIGAPDASPAVQE